MDHIHTWSHTIRSRPDIDTVKSSTHKCEFVADMCASGMLSIDMTAQYTHICEIATSSDEMRVWCDALKIGKTLPPAEWRPIPFSHSILRAPFTLIKRSLSGVFGHIGSYATQTEQNEAVRTTFADKQVGSCALITDTTRTCMLFIFGRLATSYLYLSFSSSASCSCSFLM